ncbi:DUF1489 domain-containing protein [uncultured Algimonas sp.]|uniref:DUF1489 family protein n=1 Tax=uncultured Algimonas sp. TaxID=1547920 RepID=UPI002615E4B6|nr:DUF1489 domain-containing protein [uncultured Algimonas sp.]
MVRHCLAENTGGAIPDGVMHLQKLSVGSKSIQTLADWQKTVVGRRRAKGLSAHHEHVTRMFPKQKEAIEAGGSIYWVIKGMILCRNPVVRLEEVTRRDGVKACSILMEPTPVPVVPTPRRAFQGWRYLKPEDAPEDLGNALGEGDALPPKLMRKLVELGAW